MHWGLLDIDEVVWLPLQKTGTYCSDPFWATPKGLFIGQKKSLWSGLN